MHRQSNPRFLILASTLLLVSALIPIPSEPGRGAPLLSVATVQASTRAYALPALTTTGSAVRVVTATTRCAALTITLSPEAGANLYVGRSDVSSSKALTELMPGASYTVSVPDYLARTGELLDASEYWVLGQSSGDTVYPSYVRQETTP